MASETSRTHRGWVRSSGLALAALVLAAVVACGGRPPDSTAASSAASEPPRKVALIGWDGATWKVIDPLLRAGKLPNLTRLLRNGTRGTLLAHPPMLSPALWTSLATGFPASEHGITSFQLPSPRGGDPVLASSFHRRRAALWQMASSGGRTVGFIGWWSSWPAEPVLGYIVSDHLAYNRWTDWSAQAQGTNYNLTFPPSLADELAPFAVRPETIDSATLTAIAPFNAEETQEMMAADKPVIFHAPSVFRFGYCTDASNVGFARHLLESRKQPDLFAVVFILSDVAGHVFWHHYEPQSVPDGGPDLGRLREAIPNTYAQLDRWTGDVLDRLSPDTVVVVLSDHGMGPKGVVPQPGRNPAGDHTPEGIILVSGPGVPKGDDLGDVSNLDLTPTVLALLGLPVGRDMPGHVIESLIADGRGSLRWTDSYGKGVGAAAAEGSSPAEKEYLERLRSLGYIK